MKEWENLAENGKIEDAIVSYCENNDWVSFAELTRGFEKYLKTSGDEAICFGSDANLVMWRNLSAQFADAILNLMERKKLFPHPCSVMTYAVDGIIPKLPVVVKPPKNGYTEPHWLPTCLRMVPL